MRQARLARFAQPHGQNAGMLITVSFQHLPVVLNVMRNPFGNLFAFSLSEAYFIPGMSALKIQGGEWYSHTSKCGFKGGIGGIT